LKKKRNSNEFNDVLNGSKYQTVLHNNNQISLCLFADSTPLVKSKNLSLWIMMSSILELPHKVREAKNNIVIHSLWIGNQIDFNYWLKKHQTFSYLP
jgi:hypothetical protein